MTQPFVVVAQLGLYEKESLVNDDFSKREAIALNHVNVLAS
jgi:hypothetical protein